MNEPQFIVMEDVRFQELRTLFKDNRIKSDENVYCTLLENTSYVIFRESFVKEHTTDELNVVIAHEMAHINGIMNEEEADRWALKNLSKENCKEILIDMWEERHGHEYESNL